MRKTYGRPLAVGVTLGAALALGGTVTAGAASLDGSYTGRTGDGQNVTVTVAGNKLTSISALVVRGLECTKTELGRETSDGVEAAAFPVVTTARPEESTVNSDNASFAFGSVRPDELGQGDKISFGTVAIGPSSARLTYSVEYLTQRTPASPADGPSTSRRLCTGGGEVTLKRGAAAGAARRTVALRAPVGLRGLKAGLPTLARLGTDGILVTATGSTGPGELRVSIKLAPGSKDPFRIGKGVLGAASRPVLRGRRPSAAVRVKGPLQTPRAGDAVQLLITVTFAPDRGGKPRSTTSPVTVRA